MARLPQPGGDTGRWGEVLNEYLSQSLDASGNLKSDVVTSSQLADGVVVATTIANGAVTANKYADGSITAAKIQDGSLTTAKIADGAITSAKLASSTAAPATGLRSLFIFYAPPNVANAKYSDDYAAGLLCHYDDVIIGSGLQDPGNAYCASTKSIIQKAAINPDTHTWGYIDAGVTTGNIPLSTIQTQIDQWIDDMNVTGIFLDTFGYDYHTPRSRQNDIVNYVHSKGVAAFINAWNADDAFGSTVDVTYNPAGVATAAAAGDIYLLESWICNSDAYASPHFTTISDIKTRADKAVAYRTSLGVKVYATNIILHTGTAESTLLRYAGICEGMARVHGDSTAAALAPPTTPRLAPILP